MRQLSFIANFYRITNEMLMVAVISVLLDGVVIGFIYTLIALGLALIFGISRVLNVAHGDMLMVGGVISFYAISYFNLHFAIAIVVLILITFLLGYSISMGFVSRIESLTSTAEEKLISSIIIFVGLSFILEDLFSTIIGKHFTTGVLSLEISLPTINLVYTKISSLRLMLLILILILILLTRHFLKNTKIGKAIRATSQNRNAAELLGVDHRKLSSLTFGIGTSLAGIAGLIYLYLYSVTPFMGLSLTIKSLTVIIIGGLGNFVGLLIGGLIIGISEILAIEFLGGGWQNVINILILIIVLCWRPTGVFGRIEY